MICWLLGLAQIFLQSGNHVFSCETYFMVYALVTKLYTEAFFPINEFMKHDCQLSKDEQYTCSVETTLVNQMVKKPVI